MPKLTIANNQTTVEAKVGQYLSEVCDETGAYIPFGCRAAACGTCRVRVLAGMQNLSPMEEAEADFLQNFVVKADANDRLACQCQILGDVTLEVIDTGNHNHLP